MRIFVIGRSLPETETMSVGLFEFQQAQALSRRGHEVVYLFSDNQSLRCMRKTGTRSGWSDTLFWHGSYFPVGQKLLPLYCRVKERSLERLLSEAVRRFGSSDVIHVHYPLLTMTEQSWGALRKLCPCLVVTEHWSRVQLGCLSRFQETLLKQVYREADAFLTVGGLLRDALVERFGERECLAVVPNLVCVDEAESEQETEADGAFTFLYVGSFAPGKRVPMLVEAFADAFRGSQEVRLQLIGDGAERERIRTTIRHCRVERQITMSGVCSHKEVMRRMQRAHCVVSASAYETFGVPFAEGWLCGKPVIASKHTGISGYVREENGVLFETEQKDGLASAMRRVKQRYGEYDAAWIRKEAEMRFSESSVCRELERCYGVAYERTH